MKLIDTHCHIYLEEFDHDLEQVVRNAQDAGIGALLLPNVDTTTIDRLHSVCSRYPEFAFPMMGLHPTSVGNGYAGSLNQAEQQLYKRSYCAIGEIGIDLYWDKSHLKEQKIVFEEQLRWSIGLRLPVAIHTRDAWPEVLDSLHKVGHEKLSGVFHSFSGDGKVLEEVKTMTTFKLGINGVATFKNSKLTEVLQDTGLAHLVLETDAPYLPPVPYRGKRNEPAYIRLTAQKIAEIYRADLNEVIRITGENALQLFGRIIPRKDNGDSAETR